MKSLLQPKVDLIYVHIVVVDYRLCLYITNLFHFYFYFHFPFYIYLTFSGIFVTTVKHYVHGKVSNKPWKALIRGEMKV